MRKTMFFKLIIPMIIAGIVITACKKDEPANTPRDVEVEFVIQQTDFDNLKSSDGIVPECQDLPWSYVKFTLGTVTYTSNVLNVGGELLTQAVKLKSGQSYTLSSFLVYSDVLPIGEGPEDELIRAAPLPLSEFHDLMVHPLDMEVEFIDFSKRQVVIDVLCFEKLTWEAFGFTWFEMNDVKIERQCFFGDVCTGKLDDFKPSLYEEQSQGVQMDMPAIFYIEVYKEGSLIRTFSNEGEFGWNEDTQEFEGENGEGACLEVYWANDLDVVENFTFKLYVLLPDGPGMAYKLIDVIDFVDDECPEPGQDGVVDFTVGNCNIGGADLVYPAWMDLPNGPITMKVGGSYGPGPHGTYFDVTLSGVPTGHDVSNSTIGIWCGDQDATIYLNQTYTVDVISSIGPLPGDLTITKQQLAVLNWLFNNLSAYYPQIDLFDMQAYTAAHPGDWAQIQNAIWAITLDLTPAVGSMAEDMFADASSHITYQVLPGQWAGVLFWHSPNVQVLFVMVDP